MLSACHSSKKLADSPPPPNDDQKGGIVERDGNGTSMENAVVINEQTETAGVDAEYVWLKENYPGYTLISQKEVASNGKHYDKMEIKTADGKSMTIFFDISNFFGKF
jgi:hypothetical protein